mgnify:FL=1
MEVINRVIPSEEQMEGFMEPGREGPIYMLNLLKFKDEAEYADGRETDLSGAQAYAIYGQEVVAHLQKVGGAPMFSARVERLMLGEVEELWDSAAIAMYPSRKAMLEMLMSPEYQASALHREAGLAGQLNIELVEPVGAWLMKGQAS